MLNYYKGIFYCYNMLDIVVGAQYGDEGKGRIVHNLALLPQYIAGARAAGANNAGHTVVHKGVTYKLHLIPSSVLTGKKSFLGKGMALDLNVLIDEIEKLELVGIIPDLIIDPDAHVIMPWHITLDGLNEQANGKSAAGSTGRGVAPVYASKAERTGIRVKDLFEGNISRIFTLINLYAGRVAFANPELQKDFLIADYLQKINATLSRVQVLKPFLGNVSFILQNFLDEGKDILGECAQSEMISVESPYYPYGTSSNTGASGFVAGLGIFPFKHIRQVIGVAKVYVTRVGNGPFVTEIKGDLAETLRNKGGEFGTTTGRPRRVGWLDIPMLKYSAISSGFTGIALTKLDILGGMNEILVAVHYEGGDDIPIDYEKKRPEYVTMKGWPAFTEEEYRQQLTNGIDAIPNLELRTYLKLIQNETRLPITQVCFGQSSSAFVSYL